MNRNKMNPLVRWRLKKFCDQHALDSQEIDSHLTYWENLEYLKTLTTDLTFERNLWRVEEDKDAEAQFLQYYREHFLQYYIYAVKMGETTSADMGSPRDSTGFSLAAYIRRDLSIRRGAFSLKAFTQQKT